MNGENNTTNGELHKLAEAENDKFTAGVLIKVSSVIDSEDCLLENFVTFFNRDSNHKQGYQLITDVAQEVMQDCFGLCDSGTYVYDVLNIACCSSAESAATSMLKLMIEKTGVKISTSEFKTLVNEAVFEAK